MYIRKFRAVFGAALVVIGVVIALFFPDLQFLWFDGRPFGLLVAVVGLLELKKARSQSPSEAVRR